MRQFKTGTGLGLKKINRFEDLDTWKEARKLIKIIPYDVMTFVMYSGYRDAQYFRNV